MDIRVADNCMSVTFSYSGHDGVEKVVEEMRRAVGDNGFDPRSLTDDEFILHNIKCGCEWDLVVDDTVCDDNGVMGSAGLVAREFFSVVGGVCTGVVELACRLRRAASVAC